LKERPILFSGPMVRAILDGQKTMTRRVFKFAETNRPPACPDKFRPEFVTQPCPYGQPGDRLWVREAWGGPVLTARGGNLEEKILYRQGDKDWRDHKGNPVHWHPSIFMPRWASRITLEITAVRVERLEDISEEDAKREGFTSRREFLEYFYKIMPKMRGLNPWVWVISFKRVK
jgi:hypothetical protein